MYFATVKSQPWPVARLVRELTQYTKVVGSIPSQAHTRIKNQPALTSVVQLVERWPPKQNVTGLILGQGAYIGCGFGPCQGEYKRQPINVSVPY